MNIKLNDQQNKLFEDNFNRKAYERAKKPIQ